MAFQAYIGLGSNLDQPESHIARAFQEIAALSGVSAMRCSSLYRTTPMGFNDQPDFINAAAEMVTTLTAGQLLTKLLEIEGQHHRKRKIKNGPRTLDLDILLFLHDSIPAMIKSPTLTVPHPRMHERAFVLAPLAELNSQLNIPEHGVVKDLLNSLGDQGVVRL